MRQQEVIEERYRQMTEEPIPRLVCTLAVPTIISMLITAIYNMADTFFVSKLGTSATGAVGVAFSLMAIIQAIGFTCGQGAGNYISRLLGQREDEKASKVAATGFITAFLLGTIIMLVGLLGLEPLIRLLGATDTIVPYAKQYVGIILIGAPCMAASFVINNVLRYQGSAMYAMWGITAGGVLNLVLDPLFIFGFDMGIAGAALATIISQLASFGILFYSAGVKGSLKIEFKKFTPSWEIYKEILRGGLPSFYRQGLASVAMMVLNLCAGAFGDAAIAAMSIVNRVFQFAFSALIGFGQGFQPVCGFNYGAKRYDRVKEAFWFCVKVACGTLIVLAIGIFWSAPRVIGIFSKTDVQVLEIGTRALRLQSLVFPLGAWSVMCNMLLQTIGKGTQASLLALAKQGLFFIPTLLIFSSQLGITGIQLSQPIADVLTFMLALPFGISILRELNHLQETDLESS